MTLDSDLSSLSIFISKIEIMASFPQGGARESIKGPKDSCQPGAWAHVPCLPDLLPVDWKGLCYHRGLAGWWGTKHLQR